MRHLAAIIFDPSRGPLYKEVAPASIKFIDASSTRCVTCKTGAQPFARLAACFKWADRYRAYHTSRRVFAHFAHASSQLSLGRARLKRIYPESFVSSYLPSRWDCTEGGCLFTCSPSRSIFKARCAPGHICVSGVLEDMKCNVC